jgi:hypothetical protein
MRAVDAAEALEARGIEGDIACVVADRCGDWHSLAVSSKSTAHADPATSSHLTSDTACPWSSMPRRTLPTYRH